MTNIIMYGDKIELENGLKSVVVENNEGLTFTSLRVEHGSLYEREGERGYSHLLEHVLASNNSSQYSKSEAKKIIENFGYSNAKSEIENCIYMFESIEEESEEMLSFLSDSVFSPNIDEESVNEQRGRIIPEIRDKRNTRDYHLWHEYYNLLFEDSILSEPTEGDIDVIKQATVDDLSDFYSRGYFPDNSSLFIVGEIPDNVEEIIRDNFSAYEPGNLERDVEETKKITELGESAIVTNGNKTDVRLGTHAPNQESEDYKALNIACYILGSGRFSRLQERLSDQEGFVYNIGSSYSTPLDVGFVTISYSVDSDKRDESIGAVFEEINRLKDEGIKEDELESEIKQIEYKKRKNMESNSKFLNILGFEFDSNEEYDESIEKYNRLTKEEVNEAARKYLPSSLGECALVLGVNDS